MVETSTQQRALIMRVATLEAQVTALRELVVMVATQALPVDAKDGMRVQRLRTEADLERMAELVAKLEPRTKPLDRSVKPG